MPEAARRAEPRAESRKPLARCLGEALGHLVKAVRSPVSARVEVHRRTEQHRHGELLLRRTVIDEVEPAPRDV